MKKITKEQEKDLLEKSQKIEELEKRLENSRDIEEIKQIGESLKEAYQARNQYNEYYYWLRNKYLNSFFHNLTLKQKRKFYPILYKLITFKNKKLDHLESCIINDRRTPTDRPKIFAPTHIGKFDAEIISAALNEHYYLLSGDFENIHDTFEGNLLKINGVEFVKEDDKEDRKRVSNSLNSLMKKGANIFWCPEGSWNLSPNLLMLQIYPGVIRAALESNAIIVPIAAEQYENKFLVNIGENFDARKILYNKFFITYESFCQLDDDKQRKIVDYIKGELRDTIATLKWEIIETVQMTEEEHNNNTFDKFVEQRVSEWTNTLDEFETHAFKPKGYATENEVFKPLDELQLTKENAFILCKTLNKSNDLRRKLQ